MRRGFLPRQDAHPQPDLFDGLVVVAYPGANGLAFVPGGVVPDQDQGRFSLCGQVLAARGEKIDGHGTDGTAIDKEEAEMSQKLLLPDFC